MCEECGCEKPDEPVEEPEECTPDQIEECHGDTGKHPCCEEE
ncbi:MAG TPA: hypothetical protein VM238_01460 [Phycisphaerae bacterium]|nr:hypothetical protein [Phycisphaerae bacterium]